MSISEATPEVMTRKDYEERLLYSIVVAGKSAKFAEAVVERLWDACNPYESLFDMLQRRDRTGRMKELVRDARTGNYTKTERAFTALARASSLDLCSCTPAELERIPGIGPKTSRFYILWTRPGAVHAALDVHVLRWLRSLGYAAPKSTPQSSRVYAELERAFLAEAERRGVTPRELDHAIWVEAAGHPERNERTAELVRPLQDQQGGGE